MRRSIEPVLKKWKDESERLPIILRGARQVGKSFIIEKFGKENFDSLATCNFEFMPGLALCFENLDPVVICQQLEIALNAKIIPGKTLLFFDEIQNCPKAIIALRYFKEKMPGLHVIAAGSLLEFVLHEEQFSFPVGRVQFLYLKPLSFQEYLLSQNLDSLVDLLKNVTLEKPPEIFVHERLLTHLREYFLIGGMPAVLRSYAEKKSFLECQTILLNLLETYRSDFPKYATKAEYRHLQIFFEKAPGLVCKNFKYTHISPDHRSLDLKISLEQLQWSGLLYKIMATNASGIPLRVGSKENLFKLLFLDGGLVNAAIKLDMQTAWNTGLMQINAGHLAEQFVGQELLAYENPHLNAEIYYWERDKKGSMAEIDYVIQCGPSIVPIEVKSGTTGSLKSLKQFMLEKDSEVGVRISEHSLSFHDGVLSIPMYLISELPRLFLQIAH